MKLLDHGYAELIRVDGCDADIAHAARTSTVTGPNVTDPVKDGKLIDRLLRDRHDSPFEQVGFQFTMQLPIFVMRQLVRHRVIQLNEFSGRYSEMLDLYYVPALDRMQAQSQFNKQGSAEVLPLSDAQAMQESVDHVSALAYATYHDLMRKGLTRELARIVLPVNFYTRITARASLRGIFQFLELRLDSHAQYEIRVYAEALLEFAQAAFPVATAAFQRHVLDSRRVSNDVLRDLINGRANPAVDQLYLEMSL